MTREIKKLVDELGLTKLRRDGTQLFVGCEAPSSQCLVVNLDLALLK
jgi:hypothetical protein